MSPNKQPETKPTALVVGVGAATGKAVCQTMASDYQLAMVARSQEVIDSLAASLPQASAFACDVSDRKACAETLRDIKARLGTPARILVNTESAAWGAYHDLALDQLSASFEINVVALLQLVQALFPNPESIPADTRIMISSSPAAYNPPARFLGLAPSRVAQRVMAELLHENLSGAGLQFGICSINGAIDEPKMRAVYKDQPASFFISPTLIAQRIADAFDAADFPTKLEVRGESAFA